MSARDGGPAFPVTIDNKSESPIPGFCGDEVQPRHCTVYGGLSLRDYFAAKAMPLAFAKYPDGHTDGWLGIAWIAYKAADAMLAAREAAK